MSQQALQQHGLAPVAIRGAAWYLPEHILPIAEVRTLDETERATRDALGIDTVRADDRLNSVALAERAARRALGLFVNTLLLRTDTSGEPTFRELLGRVRQADLAAFAHQDVPFDLVMEAQGPRRAASGQAVFGRSPFQVMLVLTPSLPERLELPGASAAVDLVGGGAAGFELTFGLFERRAADGTCHGLDGRIEYRTDLFDRSTVEALRDRFTLLLRTVAGAPDVPLHAIGPPGPNAH